MADDPTITRIRAVRHKISEHCHHNVKELLAHYAELEQRYQHRMVKQVQPTIRESQATEEHAPSDVMHDPPNSLAGNF